LLSKADMLLLLSLRNSFKTRAELDSENLYHRETLSKSLRKMEEIGLIIKTPREVAGRYTAEFNLTRKGRQAVSLLESLNLEGMPETGITDQRWRIMLLCETEHRFGQIQRSLQIAEPNVDRQLKILLSSGLLVKAKESYVLSSKGRELISIIGAEP